MRKIMTLFLLLKNIKRKKCRPRHLLVITSNVPSALLPTVGGIGWKQPRGLKNCLSCKGILSCTSTSHSAQTSHVAITTTNNSNLLTQVAKSRVTFHNNQSLHNLASYTTSILWELPHSRMPNWLSDFINRIAEQLWPGTGFRTLTLFR